MIMSPNEVILGENKKDTDLLCKREYNITRKFDKIIPLESTIWKYL